MAVQARRVIEIEVVADEALRKLGGIEQAASRSERSLALMKRQIDALGTAFRGFVGFLGVQEFVALGDAAQDIEARLSSVTGSVTEGQAAFEELLGVALRLGVGIEGLAESYTKLAVAVPTASQEELIQALDILSTVLATTGASAQEVNAVLLQFGQALGSGAGALQGDEFRSISENAPVLLRAWRDAIGETDTSFKELSASAKLTTESFFENLDAIQENAVAMTGMAEPPLTVARALENLRTQMIALIGDSEGMSLAFSALAQAIDLLARNLDLLVTVALAFAGLRLAETFAKTATGAGLLASSMGGVAAATATAGESAAGAARAVQQGLSAATAQQTIFLAATDAWLAFVDNTRALEKGFGSTNAVLRGLTVLLDTTIGRFIAWVAVIESASFAYERLVEAAEQQDRFIESARESAAVTRTLTDEVIAARDALEEIDTLAPAEVAARVETLEAALNRAESRAEEIRKELEQLKDLNIFEVFFGLPQQEEDRIESLEQELENLGRGAEIGEKALFRLADAQYDAERRAGAFSPTLKQITQELEAAAAAADRLSREELNLRFRIELAEAGTPLERIETEVSQTFDRITETAKAAIDNAAAQLQFLEQQRRTAQLTPEEVAGLDKEIEKLNRRVTENAAIIASNERARQQQTRTLIEQRLALAEVEEAEKGMAEAMRLLRDEFAESIPVQFALQELYEAGRISADQLAESLAKLGAVTSDVNVDQAEQQIENQRALQEANVQTAIEIENVRQRLEAYIAGGEDALRIQESQIRVNEAVADAYRELGVALGDELNPEQRKLIETTRALAEELERLALAKEAAVQARELSRALEEASESAARAEGALQAFQRGGTAELQQFEARVRLQDAFNEALRLQNTTFEDASTEQLAFARDMTEALARQLRAQEALNQAQGDAAEISTIQIGVADDISAAQESLASSIQAFQASVAGIEAPREEGEIPDFGDVRSTLEQASVARFRGEQAQAEALLELARSQTEQFAETVDSLYDERQLDRLKDQLGDAAEKILATVPLEEVDVKILEGALQGEQLLAPVQFDPESVDEAIAGLQAAVSTTPITVPVQLGVPAAGAPATSGIGTGGVGVGLPPGAGLAGALTNAANAVGN